MRRNLASFSVGDSGRQRVQSSKSPAHGKGSYVIYQNETRSKHSISISRHQVPRNGPAPLPNTREALEDRIIVIDSILNIRRKNSPVSFAAFIEKPLKEEREGGRYLFILADTLCNPHQIPYFLLLQLDIGIKYAKVELRIEGQAIQFHFVHEKSVINRCRVVGSSKSVKESAIGLNKQSHSTTGRSVWSVVLFWSA